MVFAAIAMVSHPLMGLFVLSGYIASTAKLQKTPHPLILSSDQWKKRISADDGVDFRRGDRSGTFESGPCLGQLTMLPLLSDLPI